FFNRRVSQSKSQSSAKIYFKTLRNFAGTLRNFAVGPQGGQRKKGGHAALSPPYIATSQYYIRHSRKIPPF
ncbi:MAG: hypothetical protein BWK80_46545, partial [Desulfobacteraceae bacterium IS3]